jgi:hypothetical protein
MRTHLLTALCLVGLGVAPAAAQDLEPIVLDFGFDQGASQGDIVVEARETLTLEPDEAGFVFLDSLTMSPTDTHLHFGHNARNTAIHLIVNGPIVIPAGAVLHVDGEAPNGAKGGKGGPGGFDGGDAPSIGQGGVGPGFGPGGAGAAGGGATNYGGVNYMIPPVGGSGAAGYAPQQHGGSGGGGAILVASQTSIEAHGHFSAASGPALTWPGSTGSIRLLAPAVSGAPTFTATYRRIDTLDASGLTSVGSATMGQVMIAAPAGDPRIDVVSLDGTPITDLDDGLAQYVQFPLSSATLRTVTVRLTDVSGLTHVGIRLVPEVGTHVQYLTTDADGTELEIHSETDGVAGTNYAERTFLVDLPPNLRSFVEVWTRPEKP